MITRRGVLLGSGTVAVGLAGATYLSIRSMGSMSAYNDASMTIRAPMSSAPDTAEFVRYATLAANSHNTQPWRFRAIDGGIQISPDFQVRTPAVDPDDHHIFASLGCAAENLSIAAEARGRKGELVFSASDEGSVSFLFGNGPATGSAMFDAIPHRQSTRSDFDSKPVSGADLNSLAKAAELPGVDMVLITERAAIDKVRDLVLSGNTTQIENPAYIAELKHWLRYNPRQALEAGDGLFSTLSGAPTLPDWLGPIMIDMLFSAASENEKYARQIDSSAGIAIFLAEQDNPEHWLLAGRACQRFALQATALGLKHAFINQPVEVSRFRPELADLAGMPGRRPNLVMRFGHADAQPFSMRKPVAKIIV